MHDSPPFPVLLDRDTLLRRTRELARDIVAEYADDPPLLVAVVEGARTFTSQLMRFLPEVTTFAEIRASSYGAGKVSRGKVQVVDAGLDVEGRRLLLVEDIVDSGRTVDALISHFESRGAADVQIASLLSKPSRRVLSVPIHHLGFEIDDHFVIGFGMDVGGRYRELPHVALYDEAVESA